MRGKDLRAELRDILFEAAGGVSDMANAEIDAILKLFIATIIVAKPEKRGHKSKFVAALDYNNPVINDYNQALDLYEQSLLKAIGGDK